MGGFIEIKNLHAVVINIAEIGQRLLRETFMTVPL